MLSRRFIGHGIGLRTDHYVEVLASQPDVGFFELISEIGRASCRERV